MDKAIEIGMGKRTNTILQSAFFKLAEDVYKRQLLGVGLAMDAFSVSMANGLHDPQMSRRRVVQIAGIFAIFQAVMPMTGWVCVHSIVELFSSFEKFIPLIALILLGYIGGKMLIEGIKGEEAEELSLIHI